MLQDKTSLLIIRPVPSGDIFAAAARNALGPDVDIVSSPILQISQLANLPDLSNIRTLIFTSAHAVASFAAQTKRRDFKCYAVGSGTAFRARELGFDALDGGGNAEKLVKRIKKDTPPEPCLYLRGRHVSRDIAKDLNSVGIEVQEAIVYEQEPKRLSPLARGLLDSGTPILLPLFSARSGQLFFDNHKAKGPLHVIAISENVASVVPKVQAKEIQVATKPDTDSVLAKVVQFFFTTKQLEGRPPAQ
ncbi:MAG: uroporphyrinogen-III synthase [Pseudomonadota bacterium]